jgi:hypothetical protein
MTSCGRSRAELGSASLPDAALPRRSGPELRRVTSTTSDDDPADTEGT